MRSRRRPTSAAKREDDERRRRDLAKLLVNMCLSLRSQPAPGRIFPTDEMVAKVLAVQTLHLDALEVRDLFPDTHIYRCQATHTNIPPQTLDLLDDEYSLSLLSDPISRFLRRSAHVQQESSILKSLAVGQNLVVQDRAFRVAAKLPPTVQRHGDQGQGTPVGQAEKRVVQLEFKAGERGFEAEKGAGESRTPLSVSVEDAIELDLR